MTITDNEQPVVVEREVESPAEGVSVELPPPEGDIAVEVVDDTPPEDRGHKPPVPGTKVYDPDQDQELEKYSEDSRIKRRFATMKWQQNEERRAKETAIRERDAAVLYAKSVAEQNKRLFQESHLSRRTAVTAVNSKLDVEIEQAKAAVKQAFDLSDGEAMASAQQRLSEATARKQSVSGIPIEDRIPEYEPPPLPVVQAEDAVTERTQRWKGENPWFQPGRNSPSMYALEVHQALIERGVAPDSEDYFSKIDEAVKAKFPEMFNGKPQQQVTAPAPQLKRPASIVAPVVSRDPATGKRKVTLTASQIRIANSLGVTPQQYAAQLVADEGTL